jgi:hypothetical protein
LVSYQNSPLVKDIIPIAGARRPNALVCLALMLSRPEGSRLRLDVWLLCGLGVYCVYAGRAGGFRTACFVR